MTEDIKGFAGLGFNIEELDPEENSIYSCDCHKLDEERDPHPCPEELFVVIDLGNDREGFFLCKRHFALFASDIIAAANHFGKKAGGVAEPSELLIKEDGALTYPAMVELVMETKEQLHGNT
jgi:hypothetical protein